MSMARAGRGQRGVIMIICLVFLLVISLTAAVSVRSAASSEAVANGTRTQALAMQAAEAALLHCERQVRANRLNAADGLEPQAAPAGAGTKYRWEQLELWDGEGTAANVTTVPFADSASSGKFRYFRRPPECMAQYVDVGVLNTTVITARGFGPDVSAPDAQRSAPRGAEIWLQSILTLE